MRERRFRISASIVGTLGLLVGLFGLARVAFAAPNVFNVSANGTLAYLIDGNSNEPLTLVKGETYTFNITVTGHPFWIVTAQGAATASMNAFNTGVQNNGTGATATGTVVFSVPNNAPAGLFYQCGNHNAMTGTITIVAPAPGVPAAGTIAILGLALLLGVVAFTALRRRRGNQTTAA
jgi:hypothetical protein